MVLVRLGSGRTVFRGTVYCDWGYLYLGSLMKIKGIGELLNPSPMLLSNIIEAIYHIPIPFSLNKVENCGSLRHDC